MSKFDLDPAVLDGIASRFQNASADVDALGKSVPGTRMLAMALQR